ncbi:MAG: hypothetical protein LC746_15530, partial [Acidobacteria bacterium]|nr:hypothetical protein [Acidobacteriota bacterium]
MRNRIPPPSTRADGGRRSVAFACALVLLFSCAALTLALSPSLQRGLRDGSHTRNTRLLDARKETPFTGLLLRIGSALAGARRRLSAATAASNTFAVTTAADNGDDSSPAPGSLRAAIINANLAGGGTINFQIPGAGVQTIHLTWVLPQIDAPVVIDGYTQPNASANTLAVGDNSVHLIELSGAGFNGSGLVIGPGAGGSTIRGLVINRFASGDAITLRSGGNTVEGCFIGTDPSGNTELGNVPAGVRVAGGPNNLVGGTTPQARNVISGNGLFGSTGFGNVIIAPASNVPPDPAPTGTLIRGNYIGTNAAGTAGTHAQAFQNNAGIIIKTGTGTIIGGTDADDGALDGSVGARNVISGNAEGVQVFADGSNVIAGNFIGVDATGLNPLGNFGAGIDTSI